MGLYNDDTLPIFLVNAKGVQGEDDELLEIKKNIRKRKKEN